MSPATRLDHCVIHVSDWEASRRFYVEVVGAEAVPVGAGYVFRFGDAQLNVHGPGQPGEPLARQPVMPGNSDLCFAWDGPIESAERHLKDKAIAIELGPISRFGAKGHGRSVYVRDPDGSLIEFISYEGEAR